MRLRNNKREDYIRDLLKNDRPQRQATMQDVANMVETSLRTHERDATVITAVLGWIFILMCLDIVWRISSHV